MIFFTKKNFFFSHLILYMNMKFDIMVFIKRHLFIIIVFVYKYIYIYIYIVGSQFVADRNSVGFARKTALTISFVERGFERLGLDR